MSGLCSVTEYTRGSERVGSFFFFSSRRRHTRLQGDWSSDVCSSDLYKQALAQVQPKLQAAPSPSAFKKLEPMQSELLSGHQQMESAAQAEEFEQALDRKSVV